MESSVLYCILLLASCNSLSLCTSQAKVGNAYWSVFRSSKVRFPEQAPFPRWFEGDFKEFWDDLREVCVGLRGFGVVLETGCYGLREVVCE